MLDKKDVSYRKIVVYEIPAPFTIVDVGLNMEVAHSAT